MKPGTLIIVLSIIGLILAIPAVAMQFSDEVNWSLWDFLVAAVLLSTFAAVLLFIRSKVQTRKRRVLYYAASIILFLAIWAELAVGIF